MIARIAGVLFRSLYLLGDLDKPFGYFDTLTYGWNSIIESMRIRAEFRKRAYHKAKEIRGKNVKVKDNEVLLGEKRYKNSWVMMTPSLAKGSHKEVKKTVASVIWEATRVPSSTRGHESSKFDESSKFNESSK